MATPAGAAHPSSERSRAALSDFVAAHYEQLAHRLTRYLGCPDLARDALHDAWLRLADKDAFDAVDKPGAYVYRVACNLAMDRLRSDRLSRCVDDPGNVEDGLDLIADQAPGPGAIAETRSELRSLDRALQCLPSRQQAIFWALRIDGRPRDEVAARYGLSLRRMDAALKQALRQCASSVGALR
jgi:RNA polymerase sigma factor (sigma-70 family)